MMTLRPVLVLLAGGLLTQGVPAAEPAPRLGRLFLTPEWRAALDRQRQLNIQESRAIEGDAVRLDGVVLRSSGKPTVWINGRPQTGNARDTGVLATTSIQRPDRAAVATGMEQPVDLKVGATLNQATRGTSGGLTSGEIRIRRSAQPE
jgi:hypothetical protein